MTEEKSISDQPLLVTNVAVGHYVGRTLFFCAGAAFLFFIKVNFAGILVVSTLLCGLSLIGPARTMEVFRNKFVVVDNYIFPKDVQRTKFLFEEIEMVNYSPGRGRYKAEWLSVVYKNDTSEKLGSFASSGDEVQKAAGTINYWLKVRNKSRKK
ncbi:MAG TPA: hypothetical protein VI112_10345 [Bacteroidia bacterium]|jgi:hypothetical protein